MSRLFKRIQVKPISSKLKKTKPFLIINKPSPREETTSISLNQSQSILNTHGNEQTKIEDKDESKYTMRAKRAKIKSLASIRLYNSIAQALIKIIETPYISLKVFILTCVLTVTGLSSYMVIESFLSYLAYEVATTGRTVSEIPAEFPKVSFCNCIFF